MRSQVLLCLLLAAVPAALGAPVEGSGDDELTPVENDAGVVLVPVGADDRLDYKIDNDDGSYQYGYQSGRLGDEGGYNFRHEYRREDGVLFGQYGHQLPGEESQAVNYIADGRGYRVLAEGQVYEPVSEEQLARQRGLLTDILAEEEEEKAPLELNLSLLDKITSSDEVLVSADPEASLAASPLAPYSEMDPDTGAFRFGFRSVGEDGSVTFRQENRRPNGVVVGQYGYRAAGEPGKLVSYVSDAFGYREVDAAAGPVKVVSREQALEQLEEAQEQEATFRAAAEAGTNEETGEIDAVVIEAAADDTEAVDGAGDAVVVESDGAAVVRGSDDSVVTEALSESVAEPADPQYWSQPPVYASALPYHAGVYPYHPAALPYHAAVYPYHSTVYSYPGGTTGYQFQTVHPPAPTQYQYQPYSAWYPYLTPAATPYQYQHPVANVRAKYQYPAPEYPLYEAHLYSPIVNDDEETR